MAWETLPTDYTDATWTGNKKYSLIYNNDGTVSLNDVTVYSNKEKSFFGAKDANSMNAAINAIMLKHEPWETTKTTTDNSWTIRYQKSGYRRAIIQAYKTLQVADTPLSNQVVCYVPAALKPVNTQYLTVRAVGNTGTLHGMGTAELKTDNGLYLFCEKSNYQAEYFAYGEILLVEDLGDE